MSYWVCRNNLHRERNAAYIEAHGNSCLIMVFHYSSAAMRALWLDAAVRHRGVESALVSTKQTLRTWTAKAPYSLEALIRVPEGGHGIN